MQGNAQYNRPSGGYQKNLYRQQMNAEGVKAPKGMSQKKMRIILIVAAVVWLAVAGLLVYKLKWWGLLIGLVIGLAAVAGGYFWLQHKEKEMIAYYKKIGMTEEMYIKELKRRNVDQKQIDAVRKTWKKVQVESIPDKVRKKK